MYRRRYRKQDAETPTYGAKESADEDADGETDLDVQDAAKRKDSERNDHERKESGEGWNNGSLGAKASLKQRARQSFSTPVQAVEYEAPPIATLPSLTPSEPEDALLGLARGALGHSLTNGTSVPDATRAPPIGKPSSELQQLRDMIRF
jgi:hypothetical protein